ncbi:FAD-linked oxidase C-terminal domain-containing protein [Aeromicrobium panaciterrae]|uniref:FAD-binding oxidoreductase n=1 Tax=Aeromicrobium panaciterrae TaxID=363861 RepID=UPI0031E2BE75
MTAASTLPPRALTDPELLTVLSVDRSGALPGRPLAVVRPTSVDEVQDVMRWATTTRTPVVPRGAGSGLAGGATAADGAVILDLQALDRIIDIDPLDETATVEPGVITSHLDRTAREHGLFYAPDPASADLSTLGGNIATNAGGMRCIKYGVTADAVLGLDIVLSDGRLLHTGGATLKGVTGYDLTSLFVGSEGTLGVVVGARLRLRPVPSTVATATAAFDDVAGAADACTDLASARLTPSLLELLDARTLETIDRVQGTDLRSRGAALVICQADGDDARSQIEAIAAVLAKRATRVEHTTDDQQADELLRARRLALPSIEALGRPLIEDICVPRSRLAHAIAGIERIGTATGVSVHTFAHAGDGNVHPILSYDRSLTEPPAVVHDAARQIFALALELGGTLTGEHGIGLLKREFIGSEIGAIGLDVHASIKQALDPLGLLNAGKAF